MTDHDNGLGQIHLILALSEHLLSSNDKSAPNYDNAVWWRHTAVRLAQLVINASKSQPND